MRSSDLRRPLLALGTLLLSGPLACGPGTQEEDNSALYPRTTVRWSSTQIPVCWESLPAAQATERGWVEDALRGSWAAVSAVEFVGFGLCTSGEPGIHIAVGDVGPHTKGLGTQLDGADAGMVLNFTFSTWSPGCQDTREFCIRAIAVHEMGHALGFAHEQNRPDKPDWCSSEQGSRGDALLGDWDVDSVMNYCNPRWSGDGNLSRMDVLGVQAVYGRRRGDWVGAKGDGAKLGEEAYLAADLGAGATRVSLADVTGDGRADAVAYYEGERRWYVAPSNGDGFDAPILAREQHGNPSAQALIGDADGDGRADAFTWYPSSGKAWAALSTGRAFGGDALWANAVGVGGTRALLADVTGDGRADLVVYFATGGDWWVAPSTGRGFGAATRVVRGLGAGAGFTPFAADLDGDGRAELIASGNTDASWWVARPTSGAPLRVAAPRRMGLGLGTGATQRLLADVDGDGRADVVAFARREGTWTVWRSLGTSFGAASALRRELGMALYDGLVTPVLGDLNGDRRADAIAVWR